MMWLREREADDATDPARSPGDDARLSRQRRIRCRHCGEVVGKLDAETRRRVFANPAGRVFEIVTVREARLLPLGVPTEEHTWFPGFAWRVGTCWSCRFHLGWIFDPVSKGDCFYGLITSEIEEC